MLTRENAPWVDYLEIDEETGDRNLVADAPDEIKEAYEKHQKKNQEHIDNNTMIPK